MCSTEIRNRVIENAVQPTANHQFFCRKCWFGPDDLDGLTAHLFLSCLYPHEREIMFGKPPREPSVSASDLSQNSRISVSHLMEECAEEKSRRTTTSKKVEKKRTKPSESNKQEKKRRRSGLARELKSLQLRSEGNEDYDWTDTSDEEDDLWRCDIPDFDFDEETKAFMRDAHRQSGIPMRQLLAEFSQEHLKEIEDDMKYVTGLTGPS